MNLLSTPDQWLHACTVWAVSAIKNTSPFTSHCCHTHLDYVYFEGSPTDPFLIRRIEELNKVRQKAGLLTTNRTEASVVDERDDERCVDFDPSSLGRR